LRFGVERANDDGRGGVVRFIRVYDVEVGESN
jgi:hypothetical protein